MNTRYELDIQLALASMIFLPESMRSSRIANMLAEAIRNPALACELAKNPRAVFEKQCGYSIPATTDIQVHFSTRDSIHLVLPTSSAASATVSSEIELSDEDLFSERLELSDRSPTAVAEFPPYEAYVKSIK